MNEEQEESSPARYCYRHANVETRVSCGRCGKPLCTKCMIFTPVGVKCKDCAQMRPLPQFVLTPRLYARVIPGAIALALGVGFLLSFAIGLGFIGGIIVGIVVGKALRRISGYKQGMVMELIAGSTVVLAVISSPVIAALRASGLHNLGHAIQQGFSPEMIGFNAFGIIIGVYIAIQQLR